MGGTLFLGVEGSGKTTLAMALTRAFARHATEGWYLRPVDRGAYSFATIAPGDFARDGFPSQTANVREMSWRIERRGEDLGALGMLDYPGEVYRLAFLSADDEPDPAAFRERAAANAHEIEALRAALAAASRVFVLFNLQDALDLARDDAGRGAVWVTNESLKAAKALPSKPPVTLVFTQVDRYQTADDFLHAFRPAELPLVGHDHPDIDWAMVSVLVPPESEFGIDAFVRRCTGLADFGVPDGRPADASAAPGDALRRLASAQTARPAGVPAPARKAHPSSRVPIFALAAVAGVALLSALVLLAVTLMHSRRASARLRVELEKRQAAESAAVTALAAHQAREAEQAARRARAEQEAKAAAARRVAADATAKRIAVAAWRAWQSTAEERARKIEASRARLAEALAAESPQVAHAALCDAAEAGNPEAQYRLACVYDIWGWGGWVRRREDRAGHWTTWLRRIDFPDGGRAVPVSRAAPNADEFRGLALDWYRAAAENGLAAAEEALRLHGEKPSDPTPFDVPPEAREDAP